MNNDLNKTQQHPMYVKSLFALTAIFVFGIFLILRGAKDKSDFIRTDGTITYLDKVYQELPFRNQGNFRYLKVDGYSKIFEIYVGNDFGEFSPKYNNLDSLKTGEQITIFYDNVSTERDQRLNQHLQKVEKGNVIFFITGQRDLILGSIFIGSAVFLFSVLFIQWKKGKIV
jgi:hypothetical protein